MDWQSLDILERDTTHTPCACCGETTIQISGEIEVQGEYLSWYSARWSEAHSDQPLLVTIYAGDWREGAAQETRWATRVSVVYEPEPGCSLLDWDPEHRETIDRFVPLDRNDVLNSSYAPELWACVDAVLMKDKRLEKVVR